MPWSGRGRCARGSRTRWAPWCEPFRCSGQPEYGAEWLPDVGGAGIEDIKKALGEGTTYTPYKNDPSNPAAIIVDIDGTLAHHDNVRTPFEFDKVAFDEVDSSVKDAVLSAHQYGHTILVVSGRSDSCYEDTAQWLDKHGIPYHDLFMRSRDDKRKDWIVKDEIIRTHIQDNYHVIYCLDDRNQVVDHNRAMGYKVFQVQPGDF